MRVLEWLVLLTGIGAVYTAIQDLKTTTSQDPFLFLRLFTDAHDPLPSFMAVLGFLIPLVAIGLGFDAINGEFNRRTMSRILAQPVYRDALLLGKFFAGIATLGVALVTLWLLIIGLGLLTLGVPPTGEEVIRGISFLIVSLAYGGLWLAVAMLCSVIFRAAATSALVAPPHGQAGRGSPPRCRPPGSAGRCGRRRTPAPAPAPRPARDRAPAPW